MEAGAGAGKTTIIVQWIINQIRFSDLDPRNIVAITFTKAAANELAERIQLKALEVLKDEEDPRVIERLKGVDRIFTGTIQSFCELILREMPFNANLSPGYDIVEDDGDFNENIWYKFLRDREEDYRVIKEDLARFGINYMDLKTRGQLALSNLDVSFRGYDKAKDYGLLRGEFNAIRDKYGDLEYKDIGRGKAIGKLLYGILVDKGDLDDYLRNFRNSFYQKDYDLDQYFLDLHKKGSKFQDEESYKAFIEDLYLLYRDLQYFPCNLSTEFINMLVAYKEENYRNSL